MELALVDVLVMSVFIVILTNLARLLRIMVLVRREIKILPSCSLHLNDLLVYLFNKRLASMVMLTIKSQPKATYNLHRPGLEPMGLPFLPTSTEREIKIFTYIWNPAQSCLLSKMDLIFTYYKLSILLMLQVKILQ